MTKRGVQARVRGPVGGGAQRSCRQGWRPLATAVSLLALILVGPAARGQIYEWRDEQGTRHFTNSVDALPRPAQQKAQVFVESAPMTPADGEAPMSLAGVPVTSEVREGEIGEPGEGATPPPAPDDPYERGWREGFAAGVGERLDRLERKLEQEEDVTTSPAPPAPPVVVIEIPRQERFYDPSGLYYRPPSTGVKVPFDRGRTRGRTRRQEIQDRIQAERELR